jgi:hypothetical protein
VLKGSNDQGLRVLTAFHHGAAAVSENGSLPDSGGTMMKGCKNTESLVIRALQHLRQLAFEAFHMVHCLTRNFPLSTLAIQAWKQLLLCFLMFVLCCFA